MAERTINRVRLAIETGQVAGLAELIMLVKRLSAEASTISIQELQELICRDMAITAKVIGAANTFGYNPSGTEVTSVSQAIQIIGFNRVRTLALSLMLMESAERLGNPEEQREVSAFALCNGIAAQAIMELTGGGEPEQAFICGSLRNYGRLLMATFLTEDYRQAQKLLPRLGPDGAFKHVFGLTPAVLGREILQVSNLPPTLMHGISELGPDEDLTAMRRVPQQRLVLVSAFAQRYCELINATQLSADEFRRETAELNRRFARLVPLGPEELPSLLKQVDRMVKRFLRDYGFKGATTQVFKRLDTRNVSVQESVAAEAARNAAAAQAGAGGGVKNEAAQIRDLLAEVAALYAPGAKASGPAIPGALSLPASNSASTGARGAGAAASNSADSALSPTPERLLEAGLQQIADLLRRTPLPDPALTRGQAALRLTVQVLQRSLALDECLIFVPEPNSNRFYAGHGCGRYFRIIGQKPLFGSDAKDVFGLAVARQEDVFIENARDTKVLRHIPSWFQGVARSVLLLPIKAPNRAHGLICAFRRSAPPIHVSEDVLRHLRHLRAMLSAVLAVEP